MSLVASHPGGEACVCDLAGAFDLSQPTISHHLKVLHEAGLLDREKRGVWVYYRARTGALASLGALIGDPPPDRARQDRVPGAVPDRSAMLLPHRAGRPRRSGLIHCGAPACPALQAGGSSVPAINRLSSMNDE